MEGDATALAYVVGMSEIRKRAREASVAIPESMDGEEARLVVLASEVTSDVWEESTATSRLKERGIDLDRLNEVLDAHDNWDHLVHAFEVLSILEAVKAEMEAME